MTVFSGELILHDSFEEKENVFLTWPSHSLDLKAIEINICCNEL